MAKSLEEYIREFAKRARNQLEAELAERKNQKVREVEWQGFDADGRPIVKDGDQTRAARGMGNVSQVKGSKLIYDEQNSVEYKRRKKEEAPVFKKKERVIKAAGLVPRSQLIPIEIFEAAGFVVGDYVVTYTTRYPLSSIDVESLRFTTPTTSSGEIYFDNSSKEPFSTGNATYVVMAGVVYAQSANLPGSPTAESFATVSGFLNLSASVTVTGGGNQWDAEVGSAFGLVSEAVTLDYTLQAQGNLARDAEYDVEAYYFALPNTIYYYQTNQNEQSENQFRTVDLSTYFSDDIVSHEMWHNFINTIDGTAYAFSVFHVVTGTFAESEDFSSNNPPSRDYWTEYTHGTLTHHWLHLKINIGTGQVESRKTTITKDRHYLDLAYVDDGTQDLTDRRYQVGRDRVAHAYAYADNNSSARGSSTTIVTSSQESALIAGACARPWYEDVFVNSFEGDWIYLWRNLTFASVNATTTNFDKVKRFLKTSFRNNKWVEGFHSEMPAYWFISDPSPPELIIYEPAESSNLYNGIPTVSDFYASMNAVLSGLDATTPTSYQSYFDGSITGAPSDVNSWRKWAQGLGVNGYKGPDFVGQLPESALGDTIGLYATDMERPWFSYNEPDASA